VAEEAPDYWNDSGCKYPANIPGCISARRQACPASGNRAARDDRETHQNSRIWNLLARSTWIGILRMSPPCSIWISERGMHRSSSEFNTHYLQPIEPRSDHDFPPRGLEISGVPPNFGPLASRNAALAPAPQRSDRARRVRKRRRAASRTGWGQCPADDTHIAVAAGRTTRDRAPRSIDEGHGVEPRVAPHPGSNSRPRQR